MGGVCSGLWTGQPDRAAAGLRGHLRQLNLSQLSLRGAYLQGVEMQDASLAGATLRDTIFTEAFDATWAVAVSSQGQYWAAGSRQGKCGSGARRAPLTSGLAGPHG